MIRVCLIALALTGCSILNMAKYNDSEHLLVNKIRTVAELSQDECGSKEKMASKSQEIYSLTVEAYNYESLTPYNEESINMTKSLVNVSKGLVDRYKSGDDVSEEYCKIKLKTIHDSAKAIQYSVVRKPK